MRVYAQICKDFGSYFKGRKEFHPFRLACWEYSEEEDKRWINRQEYVRISYSRNWKALASLASTVEDLARMELLELVAMRTEAKLKINKSAPNIHGGHPNPW
jgi:hypothetical protein